MAILESGATFGELCLVEPSTKRSASIVVEEEGGIAQLIVLDEEVYSRISRNQQIESSVADHLSFLEKLNIFKGWTRGCTWIHPSVSFFFA